nr:MAG TPA: hypothetical protein [Caudoviricetes sp.]
MKTFSWWRFLELFECRRVRFESQQPTLQL